MSSKTALDPGHGPFRRWIRGPWSLAARLAAGFGAAAFGILLVAMSLLYWALVSNLDREDNEYLAEKIASLETPLRDRPQDVAALQAEVEQESQQHFYPPVLIRVFDGNGQLMAETRGMAELLPCSAFPQPIRFRVERWNAMEFVTPEGRPFGLLAARIGFVPDGGEPLVQIALDQSQEQQLLAKYRKWLWLVLELGLVTCALVGYLLARRGLRPVQRMAATMRLVGSENLDERVEPAGFPSELSSLAATFNDMLQRLEDAFNRLSRFSADIAHELRTPINNVRGLAEVAVERARSGGECGELLGPCLDECQRLSRLIDNLLFLARAENPQSQIQRHRLLLGQEIETVREFYEAAAGEAGVSIDLDVAADLTADLDRLLLQRALGNLIENALAHTPRGGTVQLSAAQDDGTLRLHVTDTGRGIPAEHLPRVFERFHRVDASRSKYTGGVGLGLAIVKSIATLHGGTVEVGSVVGVGTRFTLVLPNRRRDQPVPSKV